VDRESVEIADDTAAAISVVVRVVVRYDVVSIAGRIRGVVMVGFVGGVMGRVTELLATGDADDEVLVMDVGLRERADA